MTFDSKLSPEELLTRLKSNSDSSFVQRLIGRRPIRGNFRGKKFILIANLKSMNMRSQDRFHGEISETQKGSRITGEFKVPPSSRLTAYLLSGFAGAFLVVMFYLYFKHHLFQWPILIIPVFFFGRMIFFSRDLLAGGVTSYPYIVDFIHKQVKGVPSKPVHVEGDGIDQVLQDLKKSDEKTGWNNP
jgi:hypothetical protein